MKAFGINVKKAIINTNPTSSQIMEGYLDELESADILRREDDEAQWEAAILAKYDKDVDEADIFYGDYLWDDGKVA